MTRNKFGIEPAESRGAVKRERSPGPMGAAIRDVAATVRETTEAKVEQRRKNAADARAFREAREEGRVLARVPLDEVRADALPRDRLDLGGVAAAQEMEELKASLIARGQREAIELFRDADGALQLVSGWRRLCALRQVFEETGDARFATVLARIGEGEDDRLGRYVAMAEENILREDLTFAEMAQLAITAAQDPALGEGADADAMVARLYGALHKVKRSYIRAFVALIAELGDALRWPKAVSRNLGVEVARALKAAPDGAVELRRRLAACADESEQQRALESFLAQAEPKKRTAKRRPSEKYEFHLDGLKITAKRGECRVVGAVDFADVPKERLEQAVRAFRAALFDPTGRG